MYLTVIFKIIIKCDAHAQNSKSLFIYISACFWVNVTQINFENIKRKIQRIISDSCFQLKSWFNVDARAPSIPLLNFPFKRITLLIVNNLFYRFTDDIQILVVHSSRVYNILWVLFGGMAVLIFRLLCILFKNWFQIFAIFCTYVDYKTVIGFTLRVSGIGIRDEFRSGGLKSLARIYCLHEYQVVLPEYYLICLPENGYLKNSTGTAAPSAPWAVRLWNIRTNPIHS